MRKVYYIKRYGDGEDWLMKNPVIVNSDSFHDDFLQAQRFEKKWQATQKIIELVENYSND